MQFFCVQPGEERGEGNKGLIRVKLIIVHKGKVAEY